MMLFLADGHVRSTPSILRTASHYGPTARRVQNTVWRLTRVFHQLAYSSTISWSQPPSFSVSNICAGACFCSNDEELWSVCVWTCICIVIMYRTSWIALLKTHLQCVRKIDSPPIPVPVGSPPWIAVFNHTMEDYTPCSIILRCVTKFLHCLGVTSGAS